jgi:hypothetical protein
MVNIVGFFRYINHHSGFSYVAPLTSKSSSEVGHELARIFGTAVMPEILQRILKVLGLYKVCYNHDDMKPMSQ